jgi:hypothetical protein
MELIFQVFYYTFGTNNFYYIVLGDWIHTPVDGAPEFRTCVLHLSQNKIKIMPTMMHDLYGEKVYRESFNACDLRDLMVSSNLENLCFYRFHNDIEMMVYVIQQSFYHMLRKKRMVRRMENAFLKRKKACQTIVSQFRESISNPHFSMCRRRLMREFETIQGV